MNLTDTTLKPIYTNYGWKGCTTSHAGENIVKVRDEIGIGIIGFDFSQLPIKEMRIVDTLKFYVNSFDSRYIGFVEIGITEHQYTNESIITTKPSDYTKIGEMIFSYRGQQVIFKNKKLHDLLRKEHTAFVLSNRLAFLTKGSYFNIPTNTIQYDFKRRDNIKGVVNINNKKIRLYTGIESPLKIMTNDGVFMISNNIDSKIKVHTGNGTKNISAYEHLYGEMTEQYYILSGIKIINYEKTGYFNGVKYYGYVLENPFECSGFMYNAYVMSDHPSGYYIPLISEDGNNFFRASSNNLYVQSGQQCTDYIKLDNPNQKIKGMAIIPTSNINYSWGNPFPRHITKHEQINYEI